MDDQRPIYYAKAWQENKVWVARIVACAQGGNWAVVHAATETPHRDEVHAMVRDLVATRLDADPDSYHVAVQYTLPFQVPPPEQPGERNVYLRLGNDGEERHIGIARLPGDPDQVGHAVAELLRRAALIVEELPTVDTQTSGDMPLTRERLGQLAEEAERIADEAERGYDRDRPQFRPDPQYPHGRGGGEDGD